MIWQPPDLTIRWGNYQKPDSEDDARLVDASIKALDAGIIMRRTAVEKVKDVFQIENTSAYLEELEKERDENAQKEIDTQMALMADPGESKQPFKGKE